MNQSMFYEPLPDEEVLRIVASAWGKEMSATNWFGEGQRVAFTHDEIDRLLGTDPDSFALLTILRRKHWGRDFYLANKMSPTMPGGGWTRKKPSAGNWRASRL